MWVHRDGDPVHKIRKKESFFIDVEIRKSQE